MLDVELYRVLPKLSSLNLSETKDIFDVELEELTAGSLNVRTLIYPIAECFQEQMVFFVNLVFKLLREFLEVFLVVLHDFALNNDGVERVAHFVGNGRSHETHELFLSFDVVVEDFC